MAKSWQLVISKAQGLMAKNRLEEAQAAALEALALAESFAPDDRRQGMSLELLTAILYQLKQYALSEPFMCRLLEMYRRNLGPEHLDTGTVLHNIALLYHHWGKLEDADRYYLSAVKVKSAQLGGDHPDMAVLTANYAALRSVLVPLENAMRPLESRGSKGSNSDTLSLTGQFQIVPDAEFALED